ncbi:phage portal protein [Salmonella enterica subsp. enterica serovar Thompson]|nr:phage portal protein [Salmonella enterica]EHP7123068.1 phage portal protein [Salmonella enterica subsp. enterica serovar Thompson]EHP7219074.1 phage portal protein [Salmonella enterica subsp. enterica serovar Thompson]HAF3525088.1 phage portal protein [Salmonella enterica]HAF6964922.1 phage portal protein [Salmonella enterica]
MADRILEVAHNPDAPETERLDALTQAQKQFMPKSVPDFTEIIRDIGRHNEDIEFYKALQRPNIVPFPSHAVQQGHKQGIQSVWLDERQTQMQGPWFEKSSNFSFDTARMMVDRTPILSAVVMTRLRQVARFCRANPKGEGPGFNVSLRNPMKRQTKEQLEYARALNSFFTNCGWESNPRQRQRLRRDNFSSFMMKIVRDSLVMDSSPIECEYKRNRRLGLDGFYAVDGATIRLCNEDGYEGDDEIFALQVVQGNIRSAYTYDDLIYVPRNARADVSQGGYGMSETELLVTTVTGFLNAMTYNQKYFDSNAIPKGLLHLAGDYSQDDLNSFKRYWNSMVKGINNAWSLPVMVSKNGESKASFEKFGVDVNEMMFSKWMTFLTSIICAVFGMAPEELNFESFASNPSSLRGSSTEEKITHSKDKGLRPLLAHFEDLFTDYIVSGFNPEFEFRWTGLDEKTIDQQWREGAAIRTLNEARASRGLPPTEGKWGNAPLNANMLQAWALSQSQQQSQEPAAPDGKKLDGDGEFIKSWGVHF